LGKVETLAVRERMLYFLLQIDESLAAAVAYKTGMHVPKGLSAELNQNVPADADPQEFRSIVKEGSLAYSAALSMINTVKDTIESRRIAILACDGVNGSNIVAVKTAIESAGGLCEIIADRLGFIESVDGTEPLPIDKNFLTAASVFYDAVYVPGGTNSVATLAGEADAIHFLNEAFRHCKAIAADASAMQVLQATYFRNKLPEQPMERALQDGVIITDDVNELSISFIEAIKMHRFWEREKPRKVPA